MPPNTDSTEPSATPSSPRSSFAIDVPDALLARARAGERAAFEQLYRWFERPVFNLAMRIGGDREEAAEVLQETMLKVLGKIGEFRGHQGSPFWGWLRQIAVNEALMRLRSQRRFANDLVLEDDGAHVVDPGPLPAAAADAAVLTRALNQLPSATRSVLWLYHAEGYTHEEIAALMQRTPSFSKSQLARGSRRLRELLEPEQTGLQRERAHA
ncbi:RNA polymerase sigma-70 factor (ECF subfamily) [Lysobacter niastensis]|uniref:RNA polymerase sigma-70 factor (ECF subfamily) n=1 Tax=Lysobacter niastensis TaxID=380629 RepID=A0ABU1W846_9GAMM|nr:sigma-70 family RNA polymerase sigma factor [Lysobacter niastensis]MDR7133696.1 RNA polymerase sigma-70 factor (ECF subfamily) [Lysobacter niastensis]